MQQISWQENPGANKFDMATKLVEYIKRLKSAINAESTNKVPRLLNAIESDILILRTLATSPEDTSRLNGIQAVLNMFKAFPMNSGKWTWNCDLGLDTTHSPPSPPSPASATYDCSDSADVSTCSQAAAPSGTSTTQLLTPSVTISTSACPLHQTLSYGQVGMGDHAFSSCSCVVIQEPTSEISTTQPTTPPAPSLGPPMPSPSPLLPQSPKSGTISGPAFVTTCMDIRDIYASYTLCPRDHSWVKIADFSTVQGHEEG